MRCTKWKKKHTRNRKNNISFNPLILLSQSYHAGAISLRDGRLNILTKYIQFRQISGLKNSPPPSLENGVLSNKYDDNGMFRFESIPTNNE